MKITLAGSSHWHAEMHLDAARFYGAEIAGIWDEILAKRMGSPRTTICRLSKISRRYSPARRMRSC
ncbi:hypothetical protein NKI78_06620 [Mesorhizobium sp. M0400]|uniref:hypothetical protein n=1 Tax=Mesorhizobium sp. M0400 TaxID=2956941 RepID=UPI0033391B29